MRSPLNEGKCAPYVQHFVGTIDAGGYVAHRWFIRADFLLLQQRLHCRYNSCAAAPMASTVDCDSASRILFTAQERGWYTQAGIFWAFPAFIAESKEEESPEIARIPAVTTVQPCTAHRGTAAVGCLCTLANTIPPVPDEVYSASSYGGMPLD